MSTFIILSWPHRCSFHLYWCTFWTTDGVVEKARVCYGVFLVRYTREILLAWERRYHCISILFFSGLNLMSVRNRFLLAETQHWSLQMVDWLLRSSSVGTVLAGRERATHPHTGWKSPILSREGVFAVCFDCWLTISGCDLLTCRPHNGFSEWLWYLCCELAHGTLVQRFGIKPLL